MNRWLRMVASCFFAGWLAAGCALMNDGAAKKLPSNMVATPPSYYSTAKARYLGNRYKENLDRLTEKIVRNPDTSQLQFANNISSVGGIGFFTHSATKAPDERYLELVLATPETFETKGDYSDKVQKLFSRYGQDLLSILAGDTELFQDKQLAGYGLNLNWRTVTAEGQGNRVGLARAVVYFHKDRVASFLQRNISQNELLGDAVIFAVEDDGPLQLVSYQPSETKPDFRPAIREDNLAAGTSTTKPAPAARTEPETAKKSLLRPAVRADPAKKSEPLVQKPAEAPATGSSAVTRPAETASSASDPASIPQHPAKHAAMAAEMPEIRQGRQPQEIVRPNPALTADSVARVPDVMLPAAPTVMITEPLEGNSDEASAASGAVPVVQTEALDIPTDTTHEMAGAEHTANAEEQTEVSSDPAGAKSLVADATGAKPLNASELLPAKESNRPATVARNRGGVEPVSTEIEGKIRTSAARAEPELRGVATEPASRKQAPPATEEPPAPQSESERSKAVPRVETAPRRPAKLSASSLTPVTEPGKSPIDTKQAERPSRKSGEAVIASPPAPITEPVQIARKTPSGGMRPLQSLEAETKPAETKTDVQTAQKKANRGDGASIVNEKITPSVALKKAEAIPATAPAAGAGDAKKDASVGSEQLALLRKPPEPAIERAPVAIAVPKPLHGFIIQVAFGDKQKAQSWAEKMTRRGYAVSLTEAGPEGALRVRLGNFAVRDEAERELQSFKREGMAGIIINLPQAFRPEARSSLP